MQLELLLSFNYTIKKITMKEKGYLYIQHISLSHSLKNIRGKKKLKKEEEKNQKSLQRGYNGV